MSNISTGVFCRGVLVGYATVDDSYNNKSGDRVEKTAHLIGIRKMIIDRFGMPSEVTQPLVLSDSLLKNKPFMQSIAVCRGMMVEAPLSGFSDFHNRPYVSNDCVLTPLGSQPSSVEPMFSSDIQEPAFAGDKK